MSTEAVEERLRRAEKELYRMHQKKYDIEKTIRQQESEKRLQEAHIVRDIMEEHQHRKAAANANRMAQQENPRFLQPRTVRTRQAYQSMCDFFGIS